MTIKSLIIYFWLIPCALAQSPCITVTGDQILGSDLARAVSAFARIPANTPLATSPLPGSSRTFSLSELQSFAARFAVPINSPGEVCFRLSMEALNPSLVVAAMRDALQIPDARIELMETSPATAPAGRLEFARENLGSPAAPDSKTPVPWRGDVVYAGGRRFPISAKVLITASIRRLVAAEALRSGVAIKASQVRGELIEGFPATPSGGLSADQVQGMVLLRPLAAGALIRPDNLTRPNDVNRGDLVSVEVRFGAAHLALTGQAESAGRIGDTVAIRNPDTSKVFQAQVAGVDRVMVGPRGPEASRKEGD